MARKRTTKTRRIYPSAAGAESKGRLLTGPILGPIGNLICDATDPDTGSTTFELLAAEIGTTQPTLRRILTGAVDPRASVLSKIADHFGLSLQPVPKSRR